VESLPRGEPSEVYAILEGANRHTTPIDRKKANLFVNLVCELYERTSIIITSNKGFDEWAEMMGDEIMTTAMLDRLLHHVRIFSIDGDSYRVQHSQKQSTKEDSEPELA